MTEHNPFSVFIARERANQAAVAHRTNLREDRVGRPPLWREVLDALNEHGEMTSARIADVTGRTDTSSIRTALHSLKARGLVTCRVHNASFRGGHQVMAWKAAGK